MPADPNRVELLFHRARELPPPDRAALLAVCDDPDVRQRVERLLAADAQLNVTADQLPDHTATFGPDQPTPRAADATGTLLGGKYKLVEPIGEGGMGTVWLAEQVAPVKRPVAVKLIKAGMDSRAVLARFDAERQALAVMDHPNIAKVLDAAATPDGRPFFVMELVKGVPITEFCDAKRLTPRERLELFVPVCQAIQHAHQKGVIHRDIKPSNVLVAEYDGRPVPKVIDFGVAKAAGGQLTESTFHTGVGGIVGTPQYMSPEQATFDNLDIDTRTDVYSLGVLLYELLTGSPPFSRADLATKGLMEVLRVVREEEPPKPSTKLSTADALPSLSANRGTEPAKLTRLLRNELDWVVMKALEKDRTRRYETANGFAADVLRYLAGEPVLAHPPSRTYRLTKFLRKNRGPVIATAVVLLALVAGIAGTTLGLIRAEERRREADRARADEAKQRAEAERQLAVSRRGLSAGRAAVDSAFTRISDDKLLAVEGLQPLRRELLESARKFYAEFIETWGDEPALRMDLADANLRLARVTAEIGTAPDAAALYRKVIEQCEQLRHDPDRRAAAHQTLVGARVGLGILLSKQLLDPEAARTEFTAALTEIRKLEQTPALEDYAANIMTTLGQALLALGDVDEAERNIGVALALARERAATNEPHALYVLAGRLDTLGSARRARGRYSESADLFREAAALQRRAIAAAPAVIDYQEWLGNHLFNLALVLETYLGKPAEAMAEREEAVEVWAKLAAANPSVVVYRQNVGQACADLGRATRATDPAKADAWYLRGLPVLRKLVADDPSLARIHSTLGATLDGLAQGRNDGGAHAEAAKLLTEAIAASGEAVRLIPDAAQFRKFLYTHRLNLSRVHIKLKDPAAALASAKAAEAELVALIRISRDRVAAEAEWAELHRVIANAHKAAGRPAEVVREAVRWLESAKRMLALTPTDPDAIDGVTGVFELLRGLEPSNAAAWHEQEAAYWHEQAKARPGDARLGVRAAQSWTERGELAVSAKQWPEALKWFKLARAELEARATAHPDDEAVATNLGMVLKWVGDVNWVQKKSAPAVEAWAAAVRIYERRQAATPDAPGVASSLAGLLHNLGTADEAAGRRDQALARFDAAIRYQSRTFALRPENCRQWLGNHFELRAGVLRRMDRWADAMADTNARAKLWADNPEVLLELAAEAAACVEGTTSKADAEVWGAAAVRWLRAAMAGGLRRTAVANNPDFAPLRGRPDFQRLIAPPIPPPRPVVK